MKKILLLILLLVGCSNEATNDSLKPYKYYFILNEIKPSKNDPALIFSSIKYVPESIEGTYRVEPEFSSLDIDNSLTSEKPIFLNIEPTLSFSDKIKMYCYYSGKYNNKILYTTLKQKIEYEKTRLDLCYGYSKAFVYDLTNKTSEMSQQERIKFIGERENDIIKTISEVDSKLYQETSQGNNIQKYNLWKNTIYTFFKI